MTYEKEIVTWETMRFLDKTVYVHELTETVQNALDLPRFKPDKIKELEIVTHSHPYCSNLSSRKGKSFFFNEVSLRL